MPPNELKDLFFPPHAEPIVAHFGKECGRAGDCEKVEGGGKRVSTFGVQAKEQTSVRNKVFIWCWGKVGRE